MSGEELQTARSIGTVDGEVFFGIVAWNLAFPKQLFPLPAGHACECCCFPGREDAPAIQRKRKLALQFCLKRIWRETECMDDILRDNNRDISHDTYRKGSMEWRQYNACEHGNTRIITASRPYSCTMQSSP